MAMQVEVAKLGLDTGDLESAINSSNRYLGQLDSTIKQLAQQASSSSRLVDELTTATKRNAETSAQAAARWTDADRRLNALEKAMEKLRGESDGLRKRLDDLSEAAKRNAEQADKTADRWAAAGRLIGALITWQALKAAIGAVTQAAIEGEQADMRLEAIIRATGAAAGRTARDLDRMAEELAEVTLFDDEAIKGALARLSTYTNITGETFDRATRAVLDFAAAYGMDLTAAAETVGKALGSPERAMAALTRQGYTFSAQQLEQIENFVKAGEVGKAQAIVLGEIEDGIAGVAQEMAGKDGLNSITTDLTKAWHDMLEEMGRTPQMTGTLGPFFDWLTTKMKGVTQDLSSDGEDVLLRELQEMELRRDEALKRYEELLKFTEEDGNPLTRTISHDDPNLVRARENLNHWNAEVLKVGQQIENLRKKEAEERAEAERLAKVKEEEARREAEAAAARERAKQTAEQQQKALNSYVQSLRDEYAQLTMTEEAYRRYQHEKRTHISDRNATHGEADALFEEVEAARVRKASADMDFQMQKQRIANMAEVNKAFVAFGRERIDKYSEQREAELELERKVFAMILEENKKYAQETVDVWEFAAEGIHEALTDPFERALTGQLKTLREWGQAVLDTIGRIAAQMAAAWAGQGIMSAIGSALFSSAFSDGIGGADAPRTPAVTDAGIFHGGGVVGSDAPARSVRVPAAMFSGAPRYHSGRLASDEFPAILQRGESVLTPAQMAAVAGRGRGDTYQVAVSLPITAMDGASVARVLEENQEVIAGLVAKGVKQSRTMQRAVGRRR